MARHKKKIIEYRVYDLPLNFPLLLLDGEKWRISDHISDRLHFHNCLEIGICHSDGGTMVINDVPVTFRAGDISIVPRHIPHTTYSNKGTQSLWSYIFVDVDELLSGFMMLQNLGRLMPSGHYMMNAVEYGKAHFMIRCILDELRHEKRGYQTVTRALFVALYYEIQRLEEMHSAALQQKKHHKETLAILPALEYINGAYMNRTTIADLASMCHISETHFRRLFLTIMGTSPLAFINAKRIERACTLLNTSEKQIIEIAQEVGFTSLSAFNRAFTTIVKISPRAYRNDEAHQRLKHKQKYILEYSGWTEPDK